MGRRFTEWEKMKIEELNEEGMTHREVGEQLGFSREQIREYIHRKQRKERKGYSEAKEKGRPRKTTLTKEQENELRIKELERENSLLRSFLQAVGRR